MTEWVVLIPAGDTGAVYEADVAQPVVTPISHAERTIRRLALERELAELRAEEAGAGIGPWPDPANDLEPPPPPVAAVAAGVPSVWPVDAVAAEVPGPGALDTGGHELVERVGADGITRRELMFSAQVPGPQFACFCEQVFTDQARFVAHARTCSRYAGVVRVGGAQHEPGSFKWGVVSAK